MSELLRVGFSGAAPFNLAASRHAFLTNGIGIETAYDALASQRAGKKCDALIATERFPDTAALINGHDIRPSAFASYTAAKTAITPSAGILLRSTNLVFPNDWEGLFDEIVPPCPVEKIGNVNQYYVEMIAALVIKHSQAPKAAEAMISTSISV